VEFICYTVVKDRELTMDKNSMVQVPGSSRRFCPSTAQGGYHRRHLQNTLVDQVPPATPRRFRIRQYIVDSTRRLYWVLEGVNHGSGAVESTMSSAKSWPEDGLPPVGIDERDIVLVQSFHGAMYYR
jgi:hypothetical protein